MLKRRDLVREVFRFVTSMTQNQHLKFPERRDVEVYIGGVNGNEDICHIALTAGVPLQKL